MILLVEDDPLLAETIYLLLDLHGYELSVAENGKEALTQLGWQTPELIISDWHMPEMSGLELCRTVRNSAVRSTIPLILMSGLAPRRELNAPYDVFLQKPFSSDHLLREIARLLNSSATHTVRRNGDESEHI